MPVAYVASTKEVGILRTVLVGSLLLHEGKLKQRLTWAIVILTGIAILISA